MTLISLPSIRIEALSSISPQGHGITSRSSNDDNEFDTHTISPRDICKGTRKRLSRAASTITSSAQAPWATTTGLFSGNVKVVLNRILPLSEARRAHELSQNGHARGKIVLRVKED